MQRNKFNPLLNQVIFFLLIAFLIALSLIKSMQMSMTHDESFNYLGMIDKSMWDCLFNVDCWGTANNHWLNTLFFQGTTAIFGDTAMAVRLPNVLAHLLYLIMAWLIVKKASKDLWLQLTGFALLACNPYVNDFFTVARGYGMSLAFFLTAFYFALSYIQKRRNHELLLTFLSLMLSALSVFTMLIFLPIFWFLLFLAPLLARDNRFSFIGHIKQQIVPLAICLLTAIMVYTPLSALVDEREFRWGASNLYDSYHRFISDSLYGDKLLGESTYEIFFLLAATAIVVSMGFAVVKYKNRREDTNFNPHFLAISIFIILNAGLVVQHYLLGSQYPVERKSVLYLPVLALCTYFMIISLPKYLRFFLASLVIVFSVYHMIRHTNLDMCREWYYDKYTRDMMDLIDERKPLNGKMDLAVSWHFYPSVHFYKRTRDIQWLEKIRYRKEVDKKKIHDYYYVTPGHARQLAEDYEVDTKFGACCLLLRKKASQ